MDAATLLSFMRGHRFAFQASASTSGDVQGAVVGVIVTDAFEVFFDTVETTRKMTNLRRNPRIALVIGGTQRGDERTVQYEGVPDEPSGAELSSLKAQYFESFPGGRERQAWTGITYVRVIPTWIRYSNFDVNPPDIIEFTAAQLARRA